MRLTYALLVRLTAISNLSFKNARFLRETR